MQIEQSDLTTVKRPRKSAGWKLESCLTADRFVYSVAQKLRAAWISEKKKKNKYKVDFKTKTEVTRESNRNLRSQQIS